MITTSPLTIIVILIAVMIIIFVFWLRAQKSFVKNLRETLSNRELSLKQVKLLARHYSLMDEVGRGVEIALAEELTALKRNEGKIIKLEKLLDEIQREEPYRGIQPEIRIQLERIAQKLGSDNDTLHVLVGHLREFTEEAAVYKRRQEIFAIVGLIVGAVGFVVGLLPYFPSLWQQLSTK